MSPTRLLRCSAANLMECAASRSLGVHRRADQGAFTRIAVSASGRHLDGAFHSERAGSGTGRITRPADRLPAFASLEVAAGRLVRTRDRCGRASLLRAPCGCSRVKIPPRVSRLELTTSGPAVLADIPTRRVAFAPDGSRVVYVVAPWARKEACSSAGLTNSSRRISSTRATVLSSVPTVSGWDFSPWPL